MNLRTVQEVLSTLEGIENPSPEIMRAVADLSVWLSVSAPLAELYHEAYWCTFPIIEQVIDERRTAGMPSTGALFSLEKQFEHFGAEIAGAMTTELKNGQRFKVFEHGGAQITLMISSQMTVQDIDRMSEIIELIAQKEAAQNE